MARFFQRDVFLWMPHIAATRPLQKLDDPVPIQDRPVRSLYYTSVRGDDNRVTAVVETIREMKFLPRVFKRDENKSKRVDIQLCTEMLASAYQDNYDVAFLATGDGDFVPLVEEVQRLGKRVHLIAFRNRLSDRLRRCCDTYLDCGQTFAEVWTAHLTGGEAEVQKLLES